MVTSSSFAPGREFGTSSQNLQKLWEKLISATKDFSLFVDRFQEALIYPLLSCNVGIPGKIVAAEVYFPLATKIQLYLINCSAMSPKAGLNLVKLPYILFIQQGYASVLYNPHSTHINTSDSKTDFLSIFYFFFLRVFQKENTISNHKKHLDY